MSLIEPLRTEVVLKSDYDTLDRSMRESWKSEQRLAARIRELEAEVRALRSAGYSCPTCGNDAVDSVAETDCKHPLETMHHHGFVTGIAEDFRCTLCDLVMPLSKDEIAQWNRIHTEAKQDRWYPCPNCGWLLDRNNPDKAHCCENIARAPEGK